MEPNGMTISELLAALRHQRDQRDKINALLSENGTLGDELEVSLLAKMEAAGMTADGAKVSENGMTATRRTKWRAKYEPEKWDSLMKWAVDTNRSWLIQRRLSDARIMSELVDADPPVPLPDGLAVEPYTDLDLRRTG